MPCVRFRMQSYKSEGPISIYMKRNPDLRDKMQARQKPRSKPYSRDFLFQIRIFPNENDMDARPVLITNLG